MLLLFSGYLEFVPESNIPPFAGLYLCPLRHPNYILFSSLEIMPREPIALHLLVAHIDITKPIAICNDSYRFVAYSYNILQEIGICS